MFQTIFNIVKNIFEKEYKTRKLLLKNITSKTMRNMIFNIFLTLENYLKK